MKTISFFFADHRPRVSWRDRLLCGFSWVFQARPFAQINNETLSNHHEATEQALMLSLRKGNLQATEPQMRLLSSLEREMRHRGIL